MSAPIRRGDTEAAQPRTKSKAKRSVFFAAILTALLNGKRQAQPTLATEPFAMSHRPPKRPSHAAVRAINSCQRPATRASHALLLTTPSATPPLIKPTASASAFFPRARTHFSFKSNIDMHNARQKYFNFADAVVGARLAQSSGSPTVPLAKKLVVEESYDQLPYHKHNLLKTHRLMLHSSPKHPTPNHYSFLSSSALCFNIFPETKRHLHENDFLWHAANAGSLSVPPHLQALLNPLNTCPEASTFALVVPHRLDAFLRHVSLPDMRHAVINMLADAAQGESEQGVMEMKHSLDPTIWSALHAVMCGEFDMTESANRASFLLDDALTQVSNADPWKVRVTVGIFGPPTLPFRSGVVLESMNEDWMLYSRYLPNQRVAMFVMEQLILQGRQAQVWERIRTVLDCANCERYYLCLLPAQLLEGEVVSRILLGAACVHPVQTTNSSTNLKDASNLGLIGEFVDK